MSQVQQIKEATDIVQIIGERIRLQRSGSSLKGLCPFHSEKSPSFFVSDQLQRFRCFGCGETGDVLDFLQKYDGMTFAEGLQLLADRAGIQLKDVRRTPEDDLRERLLEVLNLAKEYYHYLLTEHTIGTKAREYLQERGVSQASVKLFQLGYASPGWDGLIRYLHNKKKYSLQDLEKAGLIIRGTGGRYYDRFRGRIMFPLKDHRGRVVGFSGRLLDADPKAAKYINSPETLLYHKSNLLYGYKELFAEIKKQGEVIVVEGEFDVISSAQAHVNHVVAIKGSALTKEQVQLLMRAARKIMLCLDADAAGAEATKKAIAVVGDADVELRVIDLSEAQEGEKDVDDLARSQAAVWRKLAEQTISVYEFLLRLSLRHHQADTPEGKREIVKEIGPVFAKIPHAVEQDFYLKKLAEKLQVPLEVVQQDVRRLGGKALLAGAKDRSVEPAPVATPSPSRRAKLEQYLFFLLLESADFSAKLKTLDRALFTTGSLRAIIDHFGKQAPSGKPDLKRLTAGLGEDLKQVLFDIMYAPEFMDLKASIDPAVEWPKTLRALEKELAREQVQELQQKLAVLEQKSTRTPAEEKQQAVYLRQVVELQRQLR